MERTRVMLADHKLQPQPVGLGEDWWMARWDASLTQANSYGWRPYHSPLCSNCHRCQWNTGQVQLLALASHWIGMCGPQLQWLLHRYGLVQRGEVMVMSRAEGLPLSQPAMRMSADLVWSSSLVRAIAFFHTNTQVSTTTVLKISSLNRLQHIYDHISPMPVGHSMVTKELHRRRMGTWAYQMCLIL